MAFNRRELMEEIKKHKATFVVYCTLRGLLLLATALGIVFQNWETVYYCALTSVLMLAPAFMQRKFNITLPSTLEIVILLFIFCAEILGEMSSFYVIFPFWDSMLHTVNGFVCAAIGFALVDLLNDNVNGKIHLSPFYMAVVAFCFSMTIGVLWEFFEFGCDVLLKTDMQKDYVVHSVSSVLLNTEGINHAVVINPITETTVNGTKLSVNGYLDIGLYDTMKDLIVNFVGAVVFSIIGYIYVKTRGKGNFAKRFIPVVREKQNKKPQLVNANKGDDTP